MAVTLAAAVVTTGGQVRVDLTVTGNPAAVTITRTVDGVTVPVRGAEGVGPTPWPVTVTDWEVPVGTATYSVTGATGSDTEVAVLPAPVTCVWLVPLVNPSTKSLRVDLESHTDFGPGVISDVFQPLGGGQPIIVTGGATYETGRVVLKTSTAVEYAALTALTGQPLWVSHNPTHGFGPFYVVLLPGATERLVNVSDRPQRRLSATYYVQDRPEITTSGRVTWLDVAARYGTWTAADAAHGQWDQLIEDSKTWNG